MTPGALGHHLLEDLLEPGPLLVGQLAADPHHRAAGHVHQVAAGQADLAGQPGALVPDRVLGHLDQDRLAGLERGLDPLGLALQAAGVEVHLARVQDGVAALADVDEGGLHRGQHVLHLAEVHVADEGLVAGLVHVVLDEHPVLEHPDLGPLAALPDHHDPVHRLAPGQELRLGDDRRAPAARVAALPAPLALGLQPGGSPDRLDLARRARRRRGRAARARRCSADRPGLPGRRPAALPRGARRLRRRRLAVVLVVVLGAPSASAAARAVRRPAARSPPLLGRGLPVAGARLLPGVGCPLLGVGTLAARAADPGARRRRPWPSGSASSCSAAAGRPRRAPRRRLSGRLAATAAGVPGLSLGRRLEDHLGRLERRGRAPARRRRLRGRRRLPAGARPPARATGRRPERRFLPGQRSGGCGRPVQARRLRRAPPPPGSRSVWRTARPRPGRRRGVPGGAASVLDVSAGRRVARRRPLAAGAHRPPACPGGGRRAGLRPSAVSYLLASWRRCAPHRWVLHRSARSRASGLSPVRLPGAEDRSGASAPRGSWSHAPAGRAPAVGRFRSEARCLYLVVVPCPGPAAAWPTRTVAADRPARQVRALRRGRWPPPCRAALAPAGSPAVVTTARGRPPGGVRPGCRQAVRQVLHAEQPFEVLHSRRPASSAAHRSVSIVITAARASIRRIPLAGQALDFQAAAGEEGVRRPRPASSGSTPGSTTCHATPPAAGAARDAGPSITSITSIPSGRAASSRSRTSEAAHASVRQSPGTRPHSLSPSGPHQRKRSSGAA